LVGKSFNGLTNRAKIIGGGDPLYLKFTIKVTALSIAARSLCDSWASCRPTFQVGLLLSFETIEPQNRPGSKIETVKIRGGVSKMSVFQL